MNLDDFNVDDLWGSLVKINHEKYPEPTWIAQDAAEKNIKFGVQPCLNL